MKISIVKEGVKEITSTVLTVANKEELLTAITTAKSNPKSSYVINLTNDIYSDDVIEITSSITNITINGNRHLVTNSTVVEHSLLDEKVVFTKDRFVNSILINGNPRLVQTSADLHYIHEFYEIPVVNNKRFKWVYRSNYTDVPAGTTINYNTMYLGLNKPDNFPLSNTDNYDGKAYLHILHLWHCNPAEIVRVDSNYIYVNPTKLSTYFSDSYDYDTPRIVIVNGSQLEKGKFIVEYSNGNYTYKYYPLDDEVVTNVAIPNSKRILEIKNCANIKVTNCLFTCNDFEDVRALQSAESLDAAIYVNECANIIIDGNEFTGINGYCVRIADSCSLCKITNNYIHDTYGGGIYVSNLGTTWDTVNTQKQLTAYTKIHNNIIKSIGRFRPDACGILVCAAHDNIITNNTICDTFYDGIQTGWTWGNGESFSYNNYIAHNHIHHCMQLVLTDGGGIYTLGQQEGSIIELNRIHDIYGFSQKLNSGYCIYHDNGSAGFVDRYNILYSAIAPIGFGTRNNFILNNIMAYPLKFLFGSSGGLPAFVEKNLILSIAPIYYSSVSNYIIARNCTKGFKIEESKFAFENGETDIPFRNAADGDFYITRNFSFNGEKYTYSCNKDSYSSTTITYGVLNSIVCGVTNDNLWKSYSDTLPDMVYNENEITYENYYKILASNHYDVTNDYLNNRQ